MCLGSRLFEIARTDFRLCLKHLILIRYSFVFRCKTPRKDSYLLDMELFFPKSNVSRHLKRKII